MADNPNGKRDQLLSERELAVIRELARAIVREAGIAEDPERDALLENDKARTEFFRTVLLLDAALLALVRRLLVPSCPTRTVWACSFGAWHC